MSAVLVHATFEQVYLDGRLGLLQTHSARRSFFGTRRAKSRNLEPVRAGDAVTHLQSRSSEARTAVRKATFPVLGRTGTEKETAGGAEIPASGERGTNTFLG